MFRIKKNNTNTTFVNMTTKIKPFLLPGEEDKCEQGYNLKEKVLVRPEVIVGSNRRRTNTMARKGKLDITPSGKSGNDFTTNKKRRTVSKKASTIATELFETGVTKPDDWDKCKKNPLNIKHMRKRFKDENFPPWDGVTDKDGNLREPCNLKTEEEEAFGELKEAFEAHRLKEAFEAQIGGGGLPKLRRSGPWITVHDPLHSIELALLRGGAGGATSLGNFTDEDLLQANPMYVETYATKYQDFFAGVDTETFENLYKNTKAKVEKRKANATEREVQQAFKRRVDRMVRKIKRIRLMKKKKDLKVAVKEINETLRSLKKKRRRKMTVCVHKDFQVDKKGNLVYVPVFKFKNKAFDKAFKTMNSVLKNLKTKEFVYGVKYTNTMYYYHYNPSVYNSKGDTGHLEGTGRFRNQSEMLSWGGFGGRKHLKSIKEYKRRAKVSFLNKASLPKGMR